MDRTELHDQLAEEIPGLLRYARTIARDPATAEDLVSDTVVRALERHDSYRGDSSLATWLHRILHNLAVDRFRRQREFAAEDVVEQVEERWRDDAYTVDAAAVVARAETADELRDALVRLPSTTERRSCCTTPTASPTPRSRGSAGSRCRQPSSACGEDA